ncbi:hypothetical protein H8D04_01015 [bacterium]|nr:hypothetical protein [bacterium]
MSRTDYSTLGNFLDYDADDLEFERVTNNIDTVDIDYGVEVIFKYYRKHGFPHYKIREDEKHSHMRKLRKFDVSTIFEDKKIVQTMHALRLAWSYFPYFWEIQCGNSMNSPMETFNDDIKFRATIKKCWTWQIKHWSGEGERTHNKFHENRLRQSIKIYSGTQSVSNFRPTAAKLIYEKYGGPVIRDMSSGWGGRLLGFLASSNTKHYIGTEPSTRAYEGLLEMKKDFSYLGKKVDIYKCGSEIYRTDPDILDLAFTSPPYFDTEKYSDEPTQSYIKFPTLDKWVNEFLFQSFENCYYGLKDGKYMIINIANTSKHKTIVENAIKVAEQIGFDHVDTLQLTLSSVMGAGMKLEPCLVFKK